MILVDGRSQVILPSLLDLFSAARFVTKASIELMSHCFPIVLAVFLYQRYDEDIFLRGPGYLWQDWFLRLPSSSHIDKTGVSLAVERLWGCNVGFSSHLAHLPLVLLGIAASKYIGDGCGGMLAVHYSTIAFDKLIY